MAKILIFILINIIAINLSCTLINIPDPGSGMNSIQSGIFAAEVGDTVLVAPGVYYENINFMGKAITIASHFLITGDEADIEATVIDGGGNDSVVRIESGEDTLSYLCGFVIRNGYNSRGGGIRLYHSGAKLENLRIRDNIAEFIYTSDGGGLYADGDFYLQGYRNLIIRNVEITNNQSIASSSYGGGFCIIDRYNVLMEDVRVSENNSTGNTHAKNGGGSFSSCGDITMINCTIENNQVIAPQSASSGGLSIYMCDDIEINGCQIIGNSVESSFSRLGGMGISSEGEIIIRNCLIEGNSSNAENIWGDEAGCGGLSLVSGDFLVEDCEISGNSAGSGCGGIGIGLNCNIVLNRVFIHDNISSEGAGVWIGKADCLIINSIIYNNQSTVNGGLCINDYGRHRIVNSIFWDNEGSEFMLVCPLDLQIYHSIIENGEEGIICSGGTDYFWGEGNLDEDPMFADAMNSDFHLVENSPGIDSGINACVWWGSGAYFIPEDEIIGKNRDIGIFETGAEEYFFDLPSYLQTEEDIAVNLDLSEYMNGTFSGSCEDHLSSVITGSLISWQPEENWSGYDEVRIDVETAGGESYFDYILIGVTAVNDAPVIDLPASLSFNNIGSFEIDIVQYISDVEGDMLFLSAEGNGHITASICYPNLHLEAEPGWQGSETVTVYVEDEWQRLVSSDTIMAEVYCEPVADCGEDLYARDDEIVILDGSGSLDPLGTGLSYQWSSNSELEIINSDCALASVTLPSIDYMEEVTFYLEISDGYNNSTDSVILEYWDDEPLDLEYHIYPGLGLIRFSWLAPNAVEDADEFDLLGYQIYFGNCPFDTLQVPDNCVYMFELPGSEYDFGVQAVYSDGASAIVNIITVDDSDNEIIAETGLTSIYPNPFNPETHISYEVSETQQITIEIFNIKGQRLEVLQNEEKEAGRYNLTWQPENNPSGIYFLRFNSHEGDEYRKLILLK